MIMTMPATIRQAFTQATDTRHIDCSIPPKRGKGVVMITRRRLIRLAGAIVAGGVSFWLCLPLVARADSGCGLRDAIRYQTALESPTEEATPAYRLGIAEDFITRCPDRFEVRDAFLVAARSALDNGDARRAARHYAAAIASGARLSPAAHLDQSVALMAAGETRSARVARDAAIREWLARLSASGTAELSAHDVRAGKIYHARYITQGTDPRISAVWLAVPDGDGLPAAVVLRADSMRAGLRALMSGRAPESLTVLEHRRCRSANVLRETTLPAPPQNFDASARTVLTDSLTRRDRLESTAPGEPLPACLGLDLMFHVPAVD